MLLRFAKPLVFLLAFSPALPSASVFAADDERPAAPRLLPSDAMAYVRVDDVAELRKLLKESAAGRMANDPQIKPLMSQVYGGAVDLFNQISDRVGASLDEILSLPQGELALALIPVDPTEMIEAMNEQKEESQESEASEIDENSPDAIRERLRKKRREQRLKTQISFGLLGILESKDNTPVIRRMFDRFEEQLRQRGFLFSESRTKGVKIVTLK